MPSARCEALHTTRIIRRADPEAYRVEVVLHGQMVVEQDGRRSRLRPPAADSPEQPLAFCLLSMHTP